MSHVVTMLHVVLQMDADYEEAGFGGCEETERGGRRKRSKCVSVVDPATIASQKEELANRLKGELFAYREVEPNDYGLSTEEVCGTVCVCFGFMPLPLPLPRSCGVTTRS